MPLKVNTYLKRNLRWGALHFTLIDPEKVDGRQAAHVAHQAELAGSHAILVGGSTGVSGRDLDEVVRAIKRVVGIPVVLFPGGREGVSREADAVLFMMLLNSRDPRFVLGEQLAAVSRLHAWGVEPIPTGYLVVAPGGKVGEVGQADLVPRDSPEVAVEYALLAQYFGMDYVYLEAGSGASEPVPESMVRAVRGAVDIPVIVGGGIRDASAARRMVDAGADVFVTGNVLEGEIDVQRALRDIMRDSVQRLKKKFRETI